MNRPAADIARRSAPFGIQMRGIHKSFGGVEVLHGVDFDIAGGRTAVLLGENGAGKSTLVRLLAGALKPDSGEIVIGSERFSALDPASARKQGVRMIYQELMDAPDLSVAENISLGRWSRRGPMIRWDTVRTVARRVLDDFGVDLDLDAPVRNLSIGERQIVEIARALADNARCLVLDEPTAALSSEETGRLFDFVRQLRRRGVAIVYITHRLSEVTEIGDDVIVLRDGAVSLRGPVTTVAPDAILDAMTGGSRVRPEAHEPYADVRGEVLLSFADASSVPAFAGLTLELHAGEVVALYGKIGSGASEVLNAVFGLRALTSGSVAMQGTNLNLRGPRAAIRLGVGYVPADRQRAGGLMSRPVTDNLCAPSWPRLSRHGFLSRRVEAGVLRRWRDALRIKMSDVPSAALSSLSGGNQQKVILARWFERGSRVLCLDEPTRGVDVGARADIYGVIEQRAREGCSVLLVTSDVDEAARLADRVLVFVRGRVAAVFQDDEISVAQLTAAVSK